MPPKHRTSRNELFLVRFWLNDISSAADGQSNWGGKVQRAVSGESREFGDWDALVKALRAMLAATPHSFMPGEAPAARIDFSAELNEKGEE